MSSAQVQVQFTNINDGNYGRVIFVQKTVPRTFALLRFRLRKPIQLRAVVKTDEIDIPFKIGRVGPEDSQKQVERGDIGYWPQGQVLIIYLQDKQIKYPINLIGHIKENYGFFDELKMGQNIRCELIQQGIDEEYYL